mgnify:CR=1 FL=1
MSYHPDNHNPARDVAFKPAGPGHHFGWSCLGCGQRRTSTAGSKGRGILRRCSVCVAAKRVGAA